MAGTNESTQKLNNTLLFIVKLLIQNNITNWFIAYGTLLGIIRNNNCINNDDDIDIIIDIKYFDTLVKILHSNNIHTTKSYGIGNSRNIIKTVPTHNLASIDFYCADYDEKTHNFNDKWEKVIWTSCKENNSFIHKEWNNVILNIPYNYQQKLIGRYGNDWNIPRNTKGVMPRKKIL